jgi:glycosyltransferase involved in cell wall biosynthesis
MERAVVRHADRIIVTTEPNREELARKYGVGDKVTVIPNGYDAADFAHPAVRPPDVDGSCFNMTMTGQVVKLVDMRPFFHALAQAIGRAPALGDRLRVRLIGADPVPYADLIRDLGLTANVRYVPYMPHDRVLQYIRASNVLFLCHIPDWISAGAKMSVKLFEYFAAERAILAMTSTDSLTAGLLRDAGVGVLVAPDDVAAIAGAVLDLFAQWERGTLAVRPADGFLDRFERGRLTERLARALEEATTRRLVRGSRPITPAAVRDRYAA